MEWIIANKGTIAAALILVGAIVGAVWYIVKKSKAKNGTCGFGCSSCVIGSSCKYRPEEGRKK